MHEYLCDAIAVAEGKSKSFALIQNDKTLELFVVHFRGKFYAYENHCPHTGISLNWQGDTFLDITEQQIQCATHGALFRISDGLCEWGPCIGQHLQSIAIRELDGKLVLSGK